MLDGKPKILVIVASGIGCTILFTPTLRAIRQKFPEAEITLLGISRGFVEPIVGSDLVDKIEVFDFQKDSLFNLAKLGERLGFVRKLRKQKFDYSITAFPSNKWYFNFYAWMIGAKKRITHRYITCFLGNLQFLQNTKIPADPKLHDVEQNMNLLKPLGVDIINVSDKILFHVPESDQKFADDYFAQHFGIDKKVVGMHIGSSGEYKFSGKRWPTSKFARLADRIQRDLDARVIIFAGPAEADEVRRLEKMMKTKTHVVKEKLKVTAALIGKCDLMISNDSGLMHIAAAKNVPIVAIFGPTILSRTRPWSENSQIIYDENYHSHMKYPFTTTKAHLDPKKAAKSFENIAVMKVYEAVKKKLNA